MNDLGNEIYDGTGISDKLVCMSECRQGHSTPTYLATVPANPLMLQPPRKDKLFVPSPPSGLTMIATSSYPDSDHGFFADTAAEPGKSYTYTLFAYDGRETYSYPVFVNVNSKSQWPLVGCKLVGTK